jgi:hypothetical protein
MPVSLRARAEAAARVEHLQACGKALMAYAPIVPPDRTSESIRPGG